MNAPPQPLPGYNVHRPADRSAMLKAAGLTRIDDLFSAVPASIRLNRSLDLPPPMAEWELQRHLRGLASRNETTLTHLSFLGGGAYEHYIPAVVPALVLRGEFLTAYTPYQPEMSQGLLHGLYEFQVLMGRLLGLPAVNCSVYDGATACAEAAWMACSLRRQRRMLVAETMWPDTLEVLRTYMHGRGVEITLVPADPVSGRIDLEALEPMLSGSVAGVLVQTPNRFGVIESVSDVVEVCRKSGALTAVSVNPLMLALLQSPGEQGADIVCCEAQPLGLPLNAGGPYLGAMATRAEFQSVLPGRIVGICKDIKDDTALALVMEEREQHVSRDKATSHICSNQALMALRVVVYLATVGERGFRQLATLNAARAHGFCEKLCELPGVVRARTGSFFNEFALRLPCEAGPFLERLRGKGVFGGIAMGEWDERERETILVAVTETKSAADLERAVGLFADALEAKP